MATTTRKLADLAQFVANDSTIGTGGIAALDAGDTTTGTFATGQVPSLDADKIASGTLGSARIPSLNADKITTGTINTAQISAASVTQHVTAFDDSKLRNDVGTLALHSAITSNRVAHNLPNVFVDQFEDDTGIASKTGTMFDDNNESVDCYATDNYGTFAGGGHYDNWGRTGAMTLYHFDNNGATTFLARHLATPDSSLMNLSNIASAAIPFKFQANKPFSWTFEAYSAGAGPYAALVHVGTPFTNHLTHGQTVTEADVWTFLWQGTAADSKFYEESNVVTKTFTDSAMLAGNYSNNVYLFQRSSTGELKCYRDIGDGSAGYVAPTTLFHTFTSKYAGEMQMAIGGQGQVVNDFRQMDYLQGTLDLNATGDFISTTQTPAAAVTKMGIVVLYKDNGSGTTALNTNLKASVLATGSTYVEVVLTDGGTFSTGIKMAVCTPVTVATGSSCKYKINFISQSAGNIETQIHGVALLY